VLLWADAGIVVSPLIEVAHADLGRFSDMFVADLVLSVHLQAIADHLSAGAAVLDYLYEVGAELGT